MKRFMCMLMVVMMVALNSLTGFAITFADINDVPWAGAQTYINNAADAGLMAGENTSNGTVFRAKSNVTYCEAVQLMYNVMKKTNNAAVPSATLSKWISTMITYNVPNWAFEAVAYGLENNIIVASDISKFMTNNGDNNYATRQDVAVMFGKILAKTNQLNYSTTLTFKDTSQISNTAVPYIELLARLNILKGDSNNNFNPASAINRAEMAVIVYNTYNTLKQAQALPTQVTGTVISNKEVSTGRYTLMMSVDGQSKMYVIPSTVQVINGSKVVSPSTITAQDIVLLTCTGYEVSAATITYDAVVEQESKLEGVITYLTSTRIQIKTSEGNSYQYSIEDEDDVLVKIDGKTKELDDLIDEYHEDQDVSVSLTLDDKDEYVEKIVATTEDNDDDDDDYDGEITSLTTSSLKLDNKSKSYKIDDEDEIDVYVEDGENSNIADFDDLKTAFDEDKVVEVKIYLDNNDYITKIRGEVVEVQGYLYSLKTGSNTLRIKVDSKYYDYKYEDDADIEIDNKDKDIADLEDALADAGTNKLEIKISLEDGEVTQIQVGDIDEDNDSDDEVDGRLTSITSSRLKLSTESSYYEIDDADEVTIDVDDGTENSLTDVGDLESALKDDKEIEVTIFIKNDYVVEIQGEVVGVAGELTYVKTSGTIEVDTASGDSYTYKCDADVEVSVGSADTLSELKDLIDNKNIDVDLTIEDGYVTKIKD